MHLSQSLHGDGLNIFQVIVGARSSSFLHTIHILLLRMRHPAFLFSIMDSSSALMGYDGTKHEGALAKAEVSLM